MCNARAVVNKRWIFQRVRSRMETILATTTDGHGRLERARDRFAQAAEEPEVQRHQHQVTTGKGVAAAAVRRCRLRQHHRHWNHRHLPNGVWNRRPKCLMRQSNNRESERGAGSIQKRLKPRKAVAVPAAAVKAQPTLKWVYWICVRFSLKIPRQKVGVRVVLHLAFIC